MSPHLTPLVISHDDTSEVSTRSASSATQVHAELDSEPDGVLADIHAFISSTTDPIHSRLRSLRLDELVTLSQSKRTMNTVKEDSSLIKSIVFPIWRYAVYLWSTWGLGGVLGLTLMKELPFWDWFWSVAFAIIASIILFFSLIWCLFATNPRVVAIYEKWSNKYAHGLGLVNAANPKLFNALTPDQLAAAKSGLNKTLKSEPNSTNERQFDLDIAKFLLQISSIVYERQHGAIHHTLQEIERSTSAPVRTSSLASSHLQFHTASSTFSPRSPISALSPLHRLGRPAAKNAKEGENGDAGQDSIIAPHKILSAAAHFGHRRRTSSSPSSSNGGNAQQGKDDEDSFAWSKPGSLVRALYEGDIAEGIEKAFSAGGLGCSLFDDDNDEHDHHGEGTGKGKENEELGEKRGDEAIRAFCKRMQVDFEPVSELNNSSSAFCSFFWDPRQRWIVVAFKGTGPTEFSDFVTDLTTSLVDVNDFLPGFGKAIKGFKDRIYPTEVPLFGGGTRPWDTIRLALRALAHELNQNSVDGGADGEINVWFTGHSLGCALATLAYARAINSPEDLNPLSAPGGPKIVVRDAYLFAAPVSANRQAALAFNAKMNSGDRLRTMWRITNFEDAVATLLPQLGDRSDLNLSDTNPASFAHLGAELKMKDYPSVSTVTGSLFPRTTRVEIRSAFTPQQIADARDRVLNQDHGKERVRQAWGRMAEKIPGLGRFIAHDTVLYWDQLDRIAIGATKWLSM